MLPFGKYKGQPLTLVPIEYLVSLAGFDNNLERLASDVFECGCNVCVRFRSNSNSETEEDVYNSIRNCLNEGVVPMCIHDQEWWWYIYANHREWITRAREQFKKYRLCRVCLKPLVPIGTSRINGKSHDDWYGRTLHKQCFRSVNP
jgi:hypothetical protein